MSGFDLVPVDGGGGEDPIHLPPGETVLGRGPLLRVNDRRVSRLHGLLQNQDGQLRLKPTHLNPCFVRSSLTDDPRPLQRNSWHPLRHGDLFSLLPGQFIYRVVSVGGEDRTPRKSQAFEEEEVPVAPEPEAPSPVGQTQPHEEPTPAAPSDEEEVVNKSLNKRDAAQTTQEEAVHRDVPPPVTKRRVLPAWMMAAAAASHGPSPSSSPSSSSSSKAVKRSKAPSSSRKQATPPRAPSPEEAELSEEEMPKKKRRRKRSDEEEEAAQSKTDVPSQLLSDQRQTESKRCEVSDESDGFRAEEEEERGRGGGATSSADTNATRRGRQPTRGAAGSVGANGPGLRTPCPYGSSCYRKNPLHFQECSHPGDTDHEEEEEEEEEAERPECPYGTDCYRKNPLHRKEFKHTKKPARTTRAAPARTRDADEDSGDDDSFINDDSEDAGDDSDYVPAASDDSGNEDVDALQKEAKAFLKRRK